MKKVWQEIRDYVIIILVVVVIRTFVVTPAIVDGDSMNNTLIDGELVLINKYYYRFNDIDRFDIVVVKNDMDNDKIIKRVIGLPGDKIKYNINIDEKGNKVGFLMINGEIINEIFISEESKIDTCKFDSDICEKEITLSKNEYYVMGDNRGVSKDSRYFGVFNKDKILGKVNIRLFPFNKFGNIESNS